MLKSGKCTLRIYQFKSDQTADWNDFQIIEICNDTGKGIINLSNNYDQSNHVQGAIAFTHMAWT